jgi:endoglucanase
MKFDFVLLTMVCIIHTASTFAQKKEDTHIRVNQVGYHPEDTKIAIAFSNKPLRGDFHLVDRTSGKKVFSGKPVRSHLTGFAPFSYYYNLDFSTVRSAGTYNLLLSSAPDTRVPITISKQAYRIYPEDLLGFMRQQRCGYNPFFDAVCHTRDGRVLGGKPEEDSTYVDVTGGWHDAGDQLKYLITTSNAIARMLMAYQLFPGAFKDEVNALGQPGSNQLPDVLDEARWGLDWIHKLYYTEGKLIHQVADDRDHIGWKPVDNDPSNYGWGKNSYRVAYPATGKPQGLSRYKSDATGIANLAGRSAAAMALGYQVFNAFPEHQAYALKCLTVAEKLYALAKANEGYQQGNSYGAPYRYNEDTWTDDMEWAAASLYGVTKQPYYLDDANDYATRTATLSWIEKDTSAHYQLYPFLNVGHYVLHEHADAAMKNKLAGYYRTGIEKTLVRAQKNIYQNGVPFIWCSNNLLVDLALQIVLYEKMTGDHQYHSYLLALRDWLLGRNPWGVSMFTGIPRDGKYARDVHTSTWALTKREVPGGLVDGPIFTSIYKKLLGLTLTKPDPYAAFQNEHVVYHDDIGDYSTNEPTMDGTACAVMLIAFFADSDK